MKTWYIFTMLLLLVQLILWTFLPPPGRSPENIHLQYGEWCYWEKGLAKKRLRDADNSVQLVPLN